MLPLTWKEKLEGRIPPTLAREIDSFEAQMFLRKQGKIEGIGALTFDPSLGLFTKSTVDIKANIADTLVGKPSSKDEPKEILSKVTARVTIELKPQ